jgi:hypothetical protein
MTKDYNMENITASSITALNKNLKKLGASWTSSEIHEGFVLDVEANGKHSLFNLETGLPFEWAQNMNWGTFKFYENCVCGVKKEGKYSFFDLKTNSEFPGGSSVKADSVHVYAGNVLAAKLDGKYSLSDLSTGTYFPNAQSINAEKIRVHNKEFTEIRTGDNYSFMNLATGKYIVKNQTAKKIAVYDDSFFVFITGNNIAYCDLKSGYSGKIQNCGNGFISNVYDKRIIEFVKDFKYSYRSVVANKWFLRNCDYGEMVQKCLLTLRNGKVGYLSPTDIGEIEMGGPIGYRFLMRFMVPKTR